MKKNLLLFLFFCGNIVMHAQQNPNAYTFATNDTTTLYQLTAADTLIGPNQENVTTDAYRLPFVFGAMGSLANTFSVSASGIVFLSPSVNTFFQLTPFSVAGGNQKNWDASGMGTSSNGAICTQVFGSSPYRKMVISFEKMSFKQSHNHNNGSFQVVLHESSGIIQYIYGKMEATDNLANVYFPMVSYWPLNQHAVVNTSTHAKYASSSPYAATVSVGDITGLHSPVDGNCRSYLFQPLSIDNFIDTAITFDITESGLSNMVIPEYVYGLKYLLMASDDSTTFSSPQLVESTVISGMPGTTKYVRLFKSNGNAISTNYASGTTTFGTSRIFVSQQSGNWNDTATWGSAINVYPTWGDSVVVSVGDTINLSGFLNNFSALYLKVDGVLDFAGTFKQLRAGSIEVSNTGIILAHNRSQSVSEAVTTGSTISVLQNFTGTGTVDLRYRNSVLSVGSTDTNSSLISVKFAKNNDSIPLLPTLELMSATTVNLMTPLTVNNRIDGNSGTLITNSNLTLNRNVVMTGTSVATTFIINRFSRMSLFLGTVAHGSNNNLKLSYYSFPNKVIPNNYTPVAFTAGAEVPPTDSIYELFVGSHKGVIAGSNWRVTNTLTLQSGYVHAGAYDFTFTGSSFYFYGGGVATSGWVKRLYYDWPYTGTMETPGQMDKFFPIIANGHKRYAFLQGAVIGDGIYGVKHTAVSGTSLLPTPYTEDSLLFSKRSNSYWEIDDPASSSLSGNAFHVRASGIEEIVDYATIGICYETGTPGGTHLSSSGGNAAAIGSRTSLNSALIGSNKMYIALIDDVPLPTGLLSFEVRKNEHHGLLSWQSSNSGHLQFWVERSADAVTFEEIGNVTAITTRENNEYKFTDYQPLNGYNYYRLKILLNDGVIAYSNVRMIFFSKQSMQVALHPNPVNDLLHVTCDTRGYKGALHIQLFDITGKALLIDSFQKSQLTNSFDVSLGAIKSGLYFARITDESGTTLHQQKIVKN